MPVAAIDGPSYTSAAESVGAQPAELMFDAVRLGIGRARLDDRDASRRPRREPGDGGQGTARTVLQETRPPGRLPDRRGRIISESLAALAAMLAAGLPIRCAAISSPGEFDTHDNQQDSFAGDLQHHRRFDRRLPGRPRGGASRTVCITLVWSEFGRRTEENEYGTDHGAAGAGFVIGNQRPWRDVGEFPASLSSMATRTFE